MESFAFPDQIISICTRVLQKYSKLTGNTWILPLRFGLVLKEECMNQKAKPHKQSLMVEGVEGSVQSQGLNV